MAGSEVVDAEVDLAAFSFLIWGVSSSDAARVPGRLFWWLALMAEGPVNDKISSLHFHSVKRRKCRKLPLSMHLDDHHRRHCSLFSTDVEIPKLDVAGSIPVSRFRIKGLRALIL